VRGGDCCDSSPEGFDWERERHQDRAGRTKAVLAPPATDSAERHSHRAGVRRRSGALQAGERPPARTACDLHPAINYPTVAKGSERLRITPSPHHDDALIDELAEAMVDVWEELGLPIEPARARGGIICHCFAPECSGSQSRMACC
jgi:5-aminolevulinate synthase